MRFYSSNNKVALVLLTPPSPVSPASHRHIGRTNLFRDCAEKHLSDLPLMGYSPAKKKVVNHTCGIGISPRDADDASDSNKNEDKDYSSTPAYKIV